jgi:hypothetical protein
MDCEYPVTLRFQTYALCRSGMVSATIACLCWTFGKQPTKIVRPASWRLNSKVPNCINAYNKYIVLHCLIKKLHKVHVRNWTQEEKERRVCKIDREGKEYMKYTKKVCRKIKCCRIPFSPEASIWIRRAQVYSQGENQKQRQPETGH